jgi:peptide-methionine (R)-S-oxide reductase
MVDKQEDLKQRLNDIQYKVTQEKDTERPFSGQYWNHFEDGVYDCIVCGEKLFKSESKFDSGCGWPAFSEESYKDTINYSEDNTLGVRRVEITCKKCGSHLGHVFEDGPKPGGKRYCVNSASINFNKK